MTAGYDEWALARAPSLLAFAHALTDESAAADVAVTQALARVRSAWPRVERDDPDLEARRHVVRVCSSPRRAAVVLRVLEERSDAEIAEVLRCSEAGARRHLARGLAELPADDGTDVSPALGDRLSARAGAAPTQLLTRPEQTVARAARRRGPGFAALAVALMLGGIALVAHASRTPDGVITYAKVHAPAGWRYESYAGVQLQVPDTWGWGAAPLRSGYFPGKRHLGACGSNEAAVLSPADDASYVSSLTSFVGRPARTSDRCVPYGTTGSMPEAQAVWFDSPLAVGVRRLGTTIAETRAVGDQRVTVFSPQPAFRRQVLGTAELVDVDANGCPTRAVSSPSARSAAALPTSLSVCVYSQDSGVAELEYSERLPAGAARRYVAAVDAAPMARGHCGVPSGQWVALGQHQSSGTRWDLADPGCGAIERAGGRAVRMDPVTVRAWAVGGVTAYLSAPRGSPALAEYFAAPVS